MAGEVNLSILAAQQQVQQLGLEVVQVGLEVVQVQQLELEVAQVQPVLSLQVQQ